MNSSPLANHIGKVVCVGRNYADHAKELGNDVPTQPLLFIKPSSAIVSVHEPLTLPKVAEPVHYEAELCVQIGKNLVNSTRQEVTDAISGVTLGLDLTLRELQSKLKHKGHPWERAKAFAGSCVLADWLAPDAFGDFTKVQYQFYLNDNCKQQGDTTLMLFNVYDLLVDISHAFGLQAGDVVMTGTPKGVGTLSTGDQLKLVLAEHEWTTQVG